MAKKKKKKIKVQAKAKAKKRKFFEHLIVKDETKRKIFGSISLLSAIIFALSFFQKAGVAGKALFIIFSFLTGKTIFIIPFLLTICGLALFTGRYKGLAKPLSLAFFMALIGIAGFFEGLVAKELIAPSLAEEKIGGWLGYIFSWPFLKLFGFWVTQIIFFGFFLVAGLIFWRLLKPVSDKKTPQKEKIQEKEKPSLVNKIFTPSFKRGSVEDIPKRTILKEPKQDSKFSSLDLKPQPVNSFIQEVDYKKPTLDLLEKPQGKPSAGDINANSAIIKRTLASFDIPVEMSGVNIGPTVTQYSLKPADGIKVSKITSLSNDLALALATHPIRIEAPIPGKSLVGIEVPNKIRSFVTLRELLENPEFADSRYDLVFGLGKEVSGESLYANLEKMPHLLVAGSTGSGKTIFLNNLIISLIYRNSPEVMKFLLIDPKRVEFTIYRELPHLICPPIVDAPRAVNALKWLIDEMERRFRLLADAKSRNISSYNEKISKGQLEFEEYLPYIVLVVDELADLMAAKGRDVEDSIVRLAQMARAVGIHLVLATQRPSVEVITGLIKANITSRVTFQVASQVDSRTVLDSSGAEKLLGAGDMLFISSDITKPKRIQSAYIGEKEIKKVVKWIIEENKPLDEELKPETEEMRESLEEALNQDFEAPEAEGAGYSSIEDPLYERAKEIVIKYHRGSASLLQRRLRVGYARAARLIDSLEQAGVVGPNRGAKARKVFGSKEGYEEGYEEDEEEGDEDEWQKV